jgi:hypothetical protein
MKKLIFLIFVLLIIPFLRLFAQSNILVESVEFIVEPTTLISAGFEWKIEGDMNRNSKVEVKFRKKGEIDFKEALPMLRLGGERIYGHDQRWTFVTENMFAGSIFNLEEGTSYECHFKLTDPDEPKLFFEETRFIKTRKEPYPFQGGKTYHVYPVNYGGIKIEPAFTGLNEAYYGTGNTGDWWLVPDARVEAGDIILVHRGLYKADILNYVDPLALNFHGAYVFTQKGTEEKPIVIKAAGDGEVIFDGAGAYRLFDVMAGDYHYFEGLTIRNTQIAFYGGLKNVKGGSGLTVKNCRIEDVGIGIMTHSEESKNYYIADNVFIGRHDPNLLKGWHGFKEPTLLTSYYAIKVYGSGHVICHNTISHFHDGICVDTHGLPHKEQDKKCVSIDIYRNDIFNMSDDFIEADGGEHNIRVFENRGFNSYHAGLSAQPVFGGPVYFLRNIIYQVPGTALKFKVRSAGIYVFHNTFCTDLAIDPSSNLHMKNNLFFGPNERRASLNGGFLTINSSLDYNAYLEKENQNYNWKYPTSQSQNNADDSEMEYIKTSGLSEFTAKTGFEVHGMLSDYTIFNKVVQPNSNNSSKVIPVGDSDFRLKSVANVIDKGALLPNINSNFHGNAPDLGALELNQKVPFYGKRQ